MTIRLLTTHESWPRGTVIDLPDDVAIRLFEQGVAEPVTRNRAEGRETRRAA